MSCTENATFTLPVDVLSENTTFRYCAVGKHVSSPCLSEQCYM
jgi:hypothetical protein